MTEPWNPSSGPGPAEVSPLERTGPAEASQEEFLAGESPDRPPSGVEAELAAARAEAAGLRDAWLRAKAETENVRKQAAIEREKTRKYAIETFAEALLPVRDSLEATLSSEGVDVETLRGGVELTMRQLASAFDKAQVVAIDPAGEKFDPNWHQAMTAVPSGQPPNTVLQVFQKGYRLHDRVLRPALVSVSAAPDAA